MTENKTVIVEDQLKEAYLDYSMSVIVGRALPDVKDGLKPVHRRILFSMKQMGLNSAKPFVKSARVIGECFKYHPHGDSAVYDSLVRMAQDFSLRYPLVWGHGNFGSIDFAEPAAMRYTECKLNKLSEQLLVDIEKETVDFVPNFDGSLKEPIVLPTKVPNLLVNGSSGIAVGMATNIPPHNLKEVCNAMIALIDNSELTYIDLMNFIKGPDFPTGAEIVGTTGIKLAYKTGRGKLTVRAKSEIEDNKIIIQEIPYQINKSLLIEQIAYLAREKIIDGISDIRDESGKEGMRIVLTTKKGFDPNIILNQLYKHSPLQTTFGIINLALVNGEPKVLGLKDMCLHFINHRKDVVVRRTKYDLRKAEERDHILQGLLIALKSIDQVVSLVKSSKDVGEARNGLISNFALTEKQANAILEMRLQKLAALEQQKIINEHNELVKLIEELKAILESEDKIKEIVKEELESVSKEYGDERRTNIIEGGDDQIDVEDLIEKENVVITITHSGYIKRQALNVYKSQRRGGRGVISAETKSDEDFVEQLFVANTHSNILFFTNKGIVHWLKAYQIPEAGRYARGTSVVNLIKFGKDERVTSVVPVDEFREDNYLIMATKQGVVKKTSLKEYSRPRQGGIIGISLRENDSLVDVKLTDGTKQIMLATKDGRAVRFRESDINCVGRNSIGVRGINVRKSEVVGMVVVDSPYLLTVTDKGYGKRSKIEDYRLISRGGSGVTNIKITGKNGDVVGIKCVNDRDEIMLISKKGILIRIPLKGISVIGRNTQGVRVMNLGEDDNLSTIAKIVVDEEELVVEEEFKSEDSETIIDDPVEEIKKELESEHVEVIDEPKEEVSDINIKVIDDEIVDDESIEKNNEGDNGEEPSKKDFTLGGYEDEV